MATTRALRLDDPRVVDADDEMMRLVAELYYVRDHSQPAIAALTGFSVSKISRLLAQARETGIVRISVDLGRDHLDAVGRRVAAALGLGSVHVTPARSDAPILAARLCAVAAAPWVTQLLPETGTLGISNGYALSQLVDALTPGSARTGLIVMPLVGGWDPMTPELDANETVRRAAERLGASYRLLHAPGFLDSAETKLALLAESGIRMTTEQWRHLDVALVGVGGGPLADAGPGYRTVMGRVRPEDRARLAAKGVAGDIAGHLFNLDGEVVSDDVTDRTIAVPIETLERVERVIAVAAGPHKVTSLIGAARTGLVDTLVTDELTATAILETLASAR